MEFIKSIPPLDRRRTFLLIVPVSFLLFLVYFPSTPTNPSPLRYFSSPSSYFGLGRLEDEPVAVPDAGNRSDSLNSTGSWKEELTRARIAVCLVGGARRFELTGPSIVSRILMEYPNADLFLNSPLDKNSFKFLLLKEAPRIATIRIFRPGRIPETEMQARVLTSLNSPKGIQGLLQYFHLVEGCLTLINSHQKRHNFTYDWIVRTRVDSYWSAPLKPENFIPNRYVVPAGSIFGGLNDRFGVGDFATSSVALSRLSLIPFLDSKRLRQLNSEAAFKAQLSTKHVPHTAKRIPFCIVSDRRYSFPPIRYGVPIAAMSSAGPLSGAKCRPCTPACKGRCVARVMSGLDRWWSWTNWENGSLKLCNARGEWEKGWERLFDRVAGKRLSVARKGLVGMTVEDCARKLAELREHSGVWDAPSEEELCKTGLGRNS
ncbi:hypothetical protein MLD38_002170 [Melastoma candidum]|uniref:Uncharacterized protein n=1 Tax=Melastoma candidum TaxID=119954 RepID=A0ACB9SHJ9_9MYRT|nr:hypothetical protein MLD38_002170 [Melastoma candidum]